VCPLGLRDADNGQGTVSFLAILILEIVLVVKL
jgi:hypothetical protein